MPKKSRQKGGKKGQQKSLFLNLSCCCLETGLKPVLLLFKNEFQARNISKGKKLRLNV